MHANRTNEARLTYRSTDAYRYDECNKASSGLEWVRVRAKPQGRQLRSDKLVAAIASANARSPARAGKRVTLTEDEWRQCGIPTLLMDDYVAVVPTHADATHADATHADATHADATHADATHIYKPAKGCSQQECEQVRYGCKFVSGNDAVQKLVKEVRQTPNDDEREIIVLQFLQNKGLLDGSYRGSDPFDEDNSYRGDGNRVNAPRLSMPPPGTGISNQGNNPYLPKPSAKPKGPTKQTLAAQRRAERQRQLQQVAEGEQAKRRGEIERRILVDERLREKMNDLASDGDATGEVASRVREPFLAFAADIERHVATKSNVECIVYPYDVTTILPKLFRVRTMRETSGRLGFTLVNDANLDVRATTSEEAIRQRIQNMITILKHAQDQYDELQTTQERQKDSTRRENFNDAIEKLKALESKLHASMDERQSRQRAEVVAQQLEATNKHKSSLPQADQEWVGEVLGLVRNWRADDDALATTLCIMLNARVDEINDESLSGAMLRHVCTSGYCRRAGNRAQLNVDTRYDTPREGFFNQRRRKRSRKPSSPRPKPSSRSPRTKKNPQSSNFSNDETETDPNELEALMADAAPSPRPRTARKTSSDLDLDDNQTDFLFDDDQTDFATTSDAAPSPRRPRAGVPSGYKIHHELRVATDGNCLFDAVVKVLRQKNVKVQIGSTAHAFQTGRAMRKEYLAWIERKMELGHPFFYFLDGQVPVPESYVREARTTSFNALNHSHRNTWGTNADCMLLPEFYFDGGVTIEIHVYSQTTSQFTPNAWQTFAYARRDRDTHIVTLINSGRPTDGDGGGDHFNVLTTADAGTHRPASPRRHRAASRRHHAASRRHHAASRRHRRSSRRRR